MTGPVVRSLNTQTLGAVSQATELEDRTSWVGGLLFEIAAVIPARTLPPMALVHVTVGVPLCWKKEGG